MKQIISLLIALMTLNCCSANRFIVDVVEHPRLNPDADSFRCSGTVISVRHVLTTASCAMVETSKVLQVALVEVKFQQGGSVNKTSLWKVYFNIRRSFVNAAYRTGENMVANIAVLETRELLPATGVSPRTLGSLSDISACFLFGWGGGLADHRRESVLVQNSQSCDPNFPQAFCSNLLPNALAVCNAFEGAAVVCGSGTIDGFLLNNQECSVHGNLQRLSYHSIGEFRQWIENVLSYDESTTTVRTTDAAMTTRISIVLILSAALMKIFL